MIRLDPGHELDTANVPVPGHELEPKPKLLFIKSIFVPNKKFFDITTNSLIKLNIFTKLANILNSDLLLVGWTNHKFINYFELFLRLHKLNFVNIDKDYWALNYGKYWLMNTIINYVKNSRVSYQMIIYMDHDIHIAFSSLKQFSQYISTFSDPNIMIHGKQLGLIAFNQKGDIRHQPSIYENSHIISNMNIKVCHPVQSSQGAIACGSYMIRPDVLNQLDNFELRGVYGLDDYYLIMALENKNFMNVVVPDCYIMHPVFKHEIYDNWKKTNIIQMIKNTGTNYHQSIQESINLWNS